MNPRFAHRMDGMKASEIRELLKITQRPEVISFGGGLPAPELFPIEELKSVMADVLDRHGALALQYSTTEGHPGLRAAIASRMNATLGTRVKASDILITSGSQQGLDLTGKILLDEGDEVLCESPTYLGAISAFTAYRPRFVEVATDDEGMIPADLERRLAACTRAKLVYVVPNFQNPSGRTWTLERRLALLEAAERHGVVIVEDDPYGQLVYEGVTPPALTSLTRGCPVVYLGTFSKIFCPGMRIGWLAAPRAIYERYALVKQGADLHTSSLGQWQLLGYLERFDIEAGIARMRDVYRRRRDAMLNALAAEFPPGVSWTRPRGGLFLWVTLPPGVDARQALKRALERDVAFVPGGSFFPNGGHENTMRLNFSNMPEARIAEGIARLGAVLRELCGQAGATPAAAGSARSTT
jgi:DNA-binding transcriptional MocR family regulator